MPYKNESNTEKQPVSQAQKSVASTPIKGQKIVTVSEAEYELLLSVRKMKTERVNGQ